MKGLIVLFQTSLKFVPVGAIDNGRQEIIWAGDDKMLARHTTTLNLNELKITTA